MMRGNRGFTLVELLIVVAVIGIIAAIAVPGLLRARQSGNEASAIGSLRAIHSGQVSYAASCGGNGIANSLADLATPPNPGDPLFITVDLNANGIQKSGYTFTLAAGANSQPVLAAANTCNGTASFSTYHTTATPAAWAAPARARWPATTGARSIRTSAAGRFRSTSPARQC